MRNSQFFSLPFIVAIFPAFFPLYLFKGNLLGIPLTFTELLLIPLFVLFFFSEGLYKISFWREYAVRFPYALLFVFVLSALGGAFLMDFNRESLGILKSWVFFPMLYFFLLKICVWRHPSLIKIALWANFLAGLGLSFMALGQEWSGEFLTPDGRASGPFVSANYLALFLGPCLVFGLWQIYFAVSKYAKLAFILVTLPLGAAFLFTESYAAFIAVFGAMCLGFMFLFKNFKILSLSGILFAVIFSIFTAQLSPQKWDQFWEFEERSSTSVRLQVYEVSMNFLRRYPLQGVGLGNYEESYASKAEGILGVKPFEDVMIHPHNIFLAIQSNMGLSGLLVFVLLCFRALLWLKEPLRNGQDRHGHFVAALMLSSILLHGFFDTPILKNDLAFQFWMLLAILL